MGSRSKLWRAVLAGGLVVCAAVVAASARTQPARATQLAQFTTPGKYRWVVPAGVTKVKFDLYGASGGNVAEGSVLMAKGGAGGHTKATFTVKPGQAFEIVVGGRGANGDSSGTPAAGGGNGGGRGGPAASGYVGGAGGGGESDARLGGRGGNICAKAADNLFCGAQDRVVVAAGGGGAIDYSGVNGGAGGGASGSPGGAQPGFIGPSAGNQYTFGGGEAGREGTFGSAGGGGNGDATLQTAPPAGGGGAGWFGGGVLSQAAGAGGSSYVNALSTGYSFLASDHFGNGSVTITTA